MLSMAVVFPHPCRISSVCGTVAWWGMCAERMPQVCWLKSLRTVLTAPIRVLELSCVPSALEIAIPSPLHSRIQVVPEYRPGGPGPFARSGRGRR